MSNTPGVRASATGALEYSAAWLDKEGPPVAETRVGGMQYEAIVQTLEALAGAVESLNALDDQRAREIEELRAELAYIRRQGAAWTVGRVSQISPAEDVPRDVPR